MLTQRKKDESLASQPNRHWLRAPAMPRWTSILRPKSSMSWLAN